MIYMCIYTYIGFFYREVHKRRYLLQPMALEVFSSDGRNYLLSFPRKIRNKVYQRFMTLATGISDSATGSVAGQRRGVAVEQSQGIFSTLIGDTSVTQRWVVCTYIYHDIPNISTKLFILECNFVNQNLLINVFLCNFYK